MHRIDTATAVAVLPAPEAAGTPGYFTKGDAVGGVAATVPGPDWFNMMQEEAIAILDALGVTPDQTKADYGQIIDALLASFANIVGSAAQIFRVATAVGANDATPLAQVQSLATIASTAEAQALAENTKMLSPLRLKESFQGANQSLVINGYQKLAGGLILQWGSVGAVGAAAVNCDVVFPIAFPTACRSVSTSAGTEASDLDSASYRTNETNVQVGVPTATGFEAVAYLKVNTGNQRRVYWIAVGN